MITRLARSAVAWGTVAMGIRVLSAATLMPLATRLLDSSTLGIWYVFTALLGFAVVLDAGMTGLLGRRFARRMDQLRVENPRRPARALLGTARLIFIIMTVTTFVTLGGLGGVWVWERSAELPDPVPARVAYALLLPSFIFFTLGNMGRVLLFGANRLDYYNIAMAVGFSLQLVVSATGLVLGWGIFALVAGNVCFFLTAAAALPVALFSEPFVRRQVSRELPKDRRMAGQIVKQSLATFFNTFGNYLAMNATVLVASRFLTLEQTASYGLSLQVLMLLAQASSLWIELKQPIFSRLHAEEPRRLHALFTSRMRIAFAIFCAGTVGMILLGNVVLAAIGARTLFLAPGELLLLAVFVFLSVHQTAHEWLALCLGRNPFTKALLAGGVASVLGGCVGAHLGGTAGLILGSMLPPLAFTNWWLPRTAWSIVGLSPAGYFSLLTGIRRH